MWLSQHGAWRREARWFSSAFDGERLLGWLRPLLDRDRERERVAPPDAPLVPVGSLSSRNLFCVTTYLRRRSRPETIPSCPFVPLLGREGRGADRG
jgi:hypothetical protein